MKNDKDPNNEKSCYYPASGEEKAREKFSYRESELKCVNPIYSTFKGGYGRYNRDWTDWEYFCLWGHLRLCYDKRCLIDGWKHISLHGYKFGYTYTPVKKLLWQFDYHFAFNKKWPFIKIGFHRIWPLYDKEKF